MVPKMGPLMIILTLALLGTAAICQETCSPDAMVGENLKRLGLANNYLAVNLHRKLSSATDENTIFSPFTLSTVLTMLYSGARGDTAQELWRLLGFHRAKLDDPSILSTFHNYLTEVLEKVDPQTYAINIASALVVDTSVRLKPEYRNAVKEVFQAYVQDADITQDTATITTDKLNTWVRKKTGGTIKSVVDTIDPATALMLVSAAYFKGSWSIMFDPQDTKFHVFHNGGRQTDKSDVLMMHAFAPFRYYYEEGDFAAIELLYEGRNFSMVIFLPAELDGMAEMEQGMSPARIAFVRRHMHHTKVHLTMPKFKLAFNRDLSKELQELGVRKVFGSSSDLSGMAEDGYVPALDEVKHQAMVEVNERGSVAASISSVMMTKMIPMFDTVPEFTVDHPFLFVIVDSRSGIILFMGRVNRL